MAGRTSIETECAGVQLSLTVTRNTATRVRWANSPERSHFILNLSSSMPDFGGAMEGCLYLGSPSPGEFSWVPRNAGFSGWFGSGELTYLEISPPLSWPEPRVPRLAAFETNVFSLSLLIARQIVSSDLNQLEDNLRSLWRLLWKNDRDFVLRRGASLSLQRFEHVQRSIAENLDVLRTSRDLADRTGASMDGLNRTFQERLGMSAATYLSESRLRAARRLICSSDTPLINIAHRVGFRSQAHLTSKIRRRTGMTPTALRYVGQRQAQDWKHIKPE